MLKRTLAISVLALTQVACAMDEGGPMYEPAPVSAQHILGAERSKRELLQLEDLKIGDGPVAAWAARSRRISKSDTPMAPRSTKVPHTRTME